MNNFMTIGICFLLIVFVSIGFNNQLNKKEKEITKLKIENVNHEASNDSLKQIGDGLYSRLSYVTSEDSLNKIKNEMLDEEIEGNVLAINKLNFLINRQYKQIDSLSSYKTDTLMIDSTKYLMSHYQFSDSNEILKYENNIGVLSSIQPRKVNSTLSIEYKPIKLNILNIKETDYRYKILVKSDSENIKFLNTESYINFDVNKTPEINGRKFNIGIGGGSDVNQMAYMVGAIKIFKHQFGITYNGKNQGLQYIYFWR